MPSTESFIVTILLRLVTISEQVSSIYITPFIRFISSGKSGTFSAHILYPILENIFESLFYFKINIHFLILLAIPVSNFS